MRLWDGGDARRKRVHFAEEYNEFHHLLIWEALGGDQEWSVRFLAKHAAVVYFLVLIGLWLVSPSLAYNFSELIEAHAVDTYSEFAESNQALLQSMAPPAIAKQYYEAPDLYVFDEFQTGRPRGSRRPVIATLYDVVCAIRDDEAEHVLTMRQCQDPEVIVKSPNTEAATMLALSAGLLVATLLSSSSSSSLDDQGVRDLFENLWQGLASGSTSSSSVEGLETSSQPSLDVLGSETLREVGDEALSASSLTSIGSLLGELLQKLSRLLR